MLPAAKSSAVWSKSAPNLDKARVSPGVRNAHAEIGNVSPTLSTKSTYSMGLRLFHKMATTLSPLEWKRTGSSRNNSITVSTATDPVIRGGGGMYRNNRLSRSFGNLNETSHYDTVFSTNSFVIARGRRGISGSTAHLDDSDTSNEWSSKTER